MPRSTTRTLVLGLLATLLADTSNAAQLISSDPSSCTSSDAPYGEVVALRDLAMTCDGTYSGDEDAEEYDEEDTYGYEAAEYEEAGDNYDGAYGDEGEDMVYEDEYGGRKLKNSKKKLRKVKKRERKLEGESCHFGERAYVTGTLEITADVDTEMYIAIEVSMLGVKKRIVDGSNLCDLQGLYSTEDDVRCPEIGYYVFTENYDIPQTNYGFLTTGFTGQVSAVIEDDQGKELGCSKVAIKSQKTEDDPTLSGAEIALIVIGAIGLCFLCSCWACTNSTTNEDRKRRMPLVYPRRQGPDGTYV